MSKLLYVETEVKATLQEVFQSLTTPSEIEQWNFASDDWHCPFATVDLRVGGRQQSRMESKDGTYGFDFGATYTYIVPDKRLSMVMDDGRLWDIHLSETPNGILVQEYFEAEQVNTHERQVFGWSSILSNFKKYIEGK